MNVCQVIFKCAYWCSNAYTTYVFIHIFHIIIKSEKVSPEATTLLKPANCKSLWKKFRKEIRPMVTRARSCQVYFTLVSHYMHVH